MSHPYFERFTPIALAHRGFARDGLENSMTAFAAAVNLGYRYVETDVHATSDGILLAFHDSTLDRVTDRSGTIADLPWSQVRHAKIAGTEAIPLLEDLLGAWPELRVNIDIKSAAAIEPAARTIERTRAHDRVCIASFSDHRRRQVVRRLSAPVATSAGLKSAARFWLGCVTRSRARSAAALRQVDCLQVPERIGPVRVVSARSVELAHTAGKQVHVWTVNEPSDMRRLLDLGVDGIVTDRADLLRDVLVERGVWSF